ncbi:MAG: PEP-CTERM sorting domain-containing protein [Phormidesmis sp.]
MNLKLLSSRLAASIAALATFGMAAPAFAVTFNGGDILNITGAYKAPAPTGLYRFHTVGGSAAAVGSYGNFGVQNDSTGAFAAFGSNGSVTTDYNILSLDFGNAATYVNKSFLSLSKGGDAFTFEITEPVSQEFAFNMGSFGAGIFSFKGLFKSLDNQNLGEGFLSGQFVGGGNGSYSASLTVLESPIESVPEPSALLGLALTAGTIIVIRRRQTVSA